MSELNLPDLLCCPFCGGEAQDDFIEGESYLIECHVCDANAGPQDSEEAAIAAWNRRIAPQASESTGAADVATGGAAALSGRIEWNEIKPGAVHRLIEEPPAPAAQQQAATVPDEDRECYRFIRDSQDNALYISRNEDHSTNYVSAKQWIEECMPDEFSNVEAEELQNMKDTDTIWKVQIYPDTPIGSYTFYGATLDSVINKARAAATTDGREG